MSQDNKTKFIKDQIEKSGFPFEMEVARILKDAKWEVLPSSPYLDEDEEKWREIDIKAYKSIEQTIDGESIKPYTLEIALIIECKKSDKFAWAFFSWPRDTSDMQLLRTQHLDFLTIIKRQSLLMEEIIKQGIFSFPSSAERRLTNLAPNLFSSYQALVSPEVARKLKFFSELGIITPETFKYMTTKQKAVSYKEIKLGKAKKEVGRSEIFEAINGLIKATKYDTRLCSSVIYAGAELAKKGYGKGRLQITIFLPILVFRGELYTWHDGEVSEESQVLLEGRCHSKAYFENMLIAVVKNNYFREFLADIEKDSSCLAKQICSKRAILDEQVNLIFD